MDLDLDTSWIEKEEKRFSIEMNYKKSPMESITCYFIYIDSKNSIQKVMKEKEPLVSIFSNVGIFNSRVLQMVQHHRFLTNIRYKIMNIMRYNIHLDTEVIQQYASQDISYNFFEEISIFNDILIDPSVFIFHPLNSLYFFFKEDTMIIQPMKSILKKNGHFKTTKKVRIMDDSANKFIESVVSNSKQRITRKNMK